MTFFLTQVVLAAPLFLLVLGAFALQRWLRLPGHVAKVLTAVAFRFALPVLLFQTMSRFRETASIDVRVLVAFFGGCLVVFFMGRGVAKWLGQPSDAGAVLGVGSVFSNNAMLGLPLASLTLGAAALPTVALVLVFNALILWTLVTVSIEWARHGNPSWAGLAKTLRKVAVNPVIVGIFLGLAFDLTGLVIPGPLDVALGWVAKAAGPIALVALGLGLGEYGLGRERRVTAALVSLKLIAHPLVVWGIAWMVGLPSLETRTVVLLSSIALGANVGLMARQFGVLEVSISQALLVSTLLSAITTPLFLALVP